MKDRIRQIMEAQHMSQQVFANFIGTTPATLSGIFNDRTRPTINIIESIKKKFPDISLEWLMFGEGDMYQSGASGSGNRNDAAGGDATQPHQGVAAVEPMLDFGHAPVPTPRGSASGAAYHNGVRNTRSDYVQEEVKYVDKPPRRVTEIRVYYDDQTWESFVPSKK